MTGCDHFDNIKHCSCFGLIHCSVVEEQKFIERLMGQRGHKKSQNLSLETLNMKVMFACSTLLTLTLIQIKVSWPFRLGVIKMRFAITIAVLGLLN